MQLIMRSTSMAALALALCLATTACSDDDTTPPKKDSTVSDTGTADGGNADGATGDSATGDGPTADGVAADGPGADGAASDGTTGDATTGDATTGDGTAGLDGTAQSFCGGQLACGADQICVQDVTMIGFEYRCETVPSQCQNDRTCACVASTVCVGTYDLCGDSSTANQVSCSCPAC